MNNLLLTNEELTLDNLPRKDDPEAIYRFAHTLECTADYDSFREALNEGEPQSLTEIRMELYFAAKTFEAIDIEEHVRSYSQYYDQLVQKISDSELE